MQAALATGTVQATGKDTANAAFATFDAADVPDSSTGTALTPPADWSARSPG